MRNFFLLCLSFLTIGLFGQSGMNLTQCIDYALDNNADIDNAVLDERSEVIRTLEIAGQGLPQISASLELQSSPTLQRFFQEYTPQSFVLSEEDADSRGIQQGDVFAAENFFQLQNLGVANLRVDQLVFSSSYLIALLASKNLKELAVKKRQQTEVDIIENVSKAYYNVLINIEKISLTKANISRLDSIYRDTEQLYINGFAEKIDVDRLKVSSNNLKSDLESLTNVEIISLALLKFQMGYPPQDDLVLTSTFDEAVITPLSQGSKNIDLRDRLDYESLLINRDLQLLNIKNITAQIIPSIHAFANVGYSTQSESFGGLFRTNARFNEQDGIGPDSWYRYSTLGLGLRWNIFTGLQRHFQIQKEKIELEKLGNGIAQYQNLIITEIGNAELVLGNALRKVEVQKSNIGLANSIYKVVIEKYKEGVGSNLEVIDADTSLKEAQINYYNALYDALIAKIDLDKARGNLNK